MSGLCGWFDSARGGPARPQAAAAMGAALARSGRGAPRSGSADFGALVASGAGADVFQDSQWLAAVWGEARFADPELAALGRRHGVARALAQGYAQKGSEV